MNHLPVTYESVDWQAITAHISEMTGQYFEVQTYYNIAGNYRNEMYRIEGVKQNYFIKFNYTNCLDIFVAEAESLRELAQANIIKVPIPLCWGATQTHAYLITQYIALRDMTPVASVRLGELLAMMHRITHDQFGWHRDNYLGSTLQSNDRGKNWIEFWKKHRLGVQLTLAMENGYGAPLQDKGNYLLSDLDKFFSHYEPLPSLLHGNLWLGNCATDVEGAPVIFDPAVYYGDREIDLAVTELFGGFPQQFYDAYQEIWPLDKGYTVRKHLYNLYHILNHLNLFGGSYLKQAEDMITSLLSEIH